MNIKDKSSEVDDLISEIQMMRGLSHKHIVEYIGAFVDQSEVTGGHLSTHSFLLQHNTELGNIITII